MRFRPAAFLAVLFAFALYLVGCAALSQPGTGTTTQPSATSQPSTQPDKSLGTAVKDAESGAQTGAGIGATVGGFFGQATWGGLIGGAVGGLVGGVGTLVFGKKDPSATLNVVHSVAQGVAVGAPIAGAVVRQLKPLAPEIAAGAQAVADATAPKPQS